MLVAGLLGLGAGLVLYATRPGSLLQNAPVFRVLNVLVNIMRPIPFIIFITAVGPLTLLVMGTTIGTRSVMFPMSAMATFVIGRIVEQNLVSVDPGVDRGRPRRWARAGCGSSGACSSPRRSAR